jgi:hypothetical protein
VKNSSGYYDDSLDDDSKLYLIIIVFEAIKLPLLLHLFSDNKYYDEDLNNQKPLFVSLPE